MLRRLDPSGGTCDIDWSISLFCPRGGWTSMYVDSGSERDNWDLLVNLKCPHGTIGIDWSISNVPSQSHLSPGQSHLYPFLGDIWEKLVRFTMFKLLWDIIHIISYGYQIIISWWPCSDHVCISWSQPNHVSSDLIFHKLYSLPGTAGGRDTTRSTANAIFSQIIEQYSLKASKYCRC